MIAKLETLVISGNNGCTLLHQMICKDFPEELMAHLIDAGVPVDSRTTDGNTALHLACGGNMLPAAKLLISHGADVNAKDTYGCTPLFSAIMNSYTDLTRDVLQQQGAIRFQWDNILFLGLMHKMPELATLYLDNFVDMRGFFYGLILSEYFDLASIYGKPKQGTNESFALAIALIYGEPKQYKIEPSALAIAVEHANTKNVLNHPVMKYIINVKWSKMREYFLKELAVYVGLVISFYAAIILGSSDWIHFERSSDYTTVVLRIISWLCCLYLVVNVELAEFRSAKYFKSYWNWFNLVSYGGILASIPLEFIGKPTLSASRGLIAMVSVSLWMNLLQYLMIHKKTGLLIATMERMIVDISQFFLLYSIFQFGFTGALYLILHGADGYDTFLNAFVSVILIFFGNLTYDPFKAATGWQWALSNLLLLIYLISVVIMLLNVLVAMLTMSIDSVTQAAEDQYLLHKSETILRIENSLPLSVREKQFKQLVPEDYGQKKMPDPSSPDIPVTTTTSNLVDNARKHGKNSNKVLPLEIFTWHTVPDRVSNARELQDGIREEAFEGKSRDISTELESRFEILQEKIDIQTKTILDLQKQQQERDKLDIQTQTMTAAILELQKQQQAFQQMILDKLSRVENHAKYKDTESW